MSNITSFPIPTTPITQSALTPYATRAAFIAANIAAPIVRTAFIVNGETYAVIRDASGPITQSNGQRWSPDGPASPEHFGIVGSVLIPTHWPTLQAAFDALGPQRKPVTVNIETGHALTHGLHLTGGDFSRYTITSSDATVTLAPGFQGVAGIDAFSNNSLFIAQKTLCPTWSILVDMDDNYGCGIVCSEKSDMIIALNKGVINAGQFGLYVRQQSNALATNANFSGAGWGNRVTTNSNLCAPQCNFSGAKSSSYGSPTLGTTANLDVSRGSVVYITGATGGLTNLTGGLGRGLAVRRSFVSATLVDTSNNGLEGLIADLGSVVAFTGSVSNGNGGNGVTSIASWVSFAQGAAQDNANFNLFANAGGSILARDGSFTGGGVQGVRAAEGGYILVNESDCRRNGVSDQTTDISVTDGSTIVALDAIGGTSQNPFSHTAAGVIYKTANTRALNVSGSSDNTQLLDFNFTNLSTGSATLRFFRGTNTTGAKRLQLFRGDGTATIDVQIGVGGQNSYFQNGNTGFGPGTSSPAYTVDVNGDINIRTGGVLRHNATQVVGARVINAALSNSANTGDANTDALIEALKAIITTHGLGAAS